MPGMDIERIVRSRVRMLMNEVPEADISYDIMEQGDVGWGVITVIDRANDVTCIEFVESSESVAFSGSMDRYIEAASAGPVLVVVPDGSEAMAADLLAAIGDPSIALVSYAVVDLTLMA